MRKGENPAEVLGHVKAKIAELNEKVLPNDVYRKTFYDRDVLMDHCTHTVIHNLIEGIILVMLIVLIFMADWRTTLTVGVVVPLALLFVFVCLRLKGMSANLLSMGAIDFGIIIDGAVVMVEGIFVVRDHKAQQVGMEKFNKLAKLGIFGNGKDAALVLANVPFALIGGIAALHITGVNFSISAGIVFIALLGICIQNGIVLITVFKENLRKKLSLAESLRLGVASPVRPVVMTALMAMIVLFPAAISNGIGSETQKPLAIVVIGGLVTATVLTLLIFPLIFAFFYREMHHDGPAPKRISEERPVLVGAKPNLVRTLAAPALGCSPRAALPGKNFACANQLFSAQRIVYKISPNGFF